MKPWPVVDNPLLATEFWTAKLTAVTVIGMDLWLLVGPWRLAYDRSYSQILPSGEMLARGLRSQWWSAC